MKIGWTEERGNPTVEESCPAGFMRTLWSEEPPIDWQSFTHQQRRFFARYAKEETGETERTTNKAHSLVANVKRGHQGAV